MPKRTRPVEVPVPTPFREALLEIAVEGEDGTTSMRALVDTAREALQKANAALSESRLADIVVKDLLRENKKRGQGTIRIDAHGNMILYLGELITDDAMLHTTAPGGSGLPSLEALRDLAEQRGVDISDLGRRKRDIMQRLSGSESAESDADEASPPSRLRDEVRKGTPLHRVKIPR